MRYFYKVAVILAALACISLAHSVYGKNCGKINTSVYIELTNNKVENIYKTKENSSLGAENYVQVDSGERESIWDYMIYLL